MSGIRHVGLVPEPDLLFGRGGRCIDQTTGLSLFGPIRPSYSDKEEQVQVSLGVIGSKQTVDLFHVLVSTLSGHVPAVPNKQFMPHFPGLSTGSILGFSLAARPTDTELITTREIDSLSKKSDYQERVGFAYDCLCDKLRNLAEREPRVDIVVIAIPPEFEEQCTRYWDRSGRPLSSRRRSRAGRAHYQEFDDLREAEEQIAEKLQFTSMYRAVKTEAMRVGIPTQVLRPSTLMEKGVEDRCTIAWNLAVAMCYKSGGHPWRLASASVGTCYVGISFYESLDDFDLRTSVAQIFSHRGEGLIMRGGKAEKGRLGREPRLSKLTAKKLVEDVLRTYERQEKALPSRLVIHKSSRFSDDEIEGIRSASPDVHELDLIALDRSYFRLFRGGVNPPVRGTYAVTSDDRVHLYTKGYVPFMRCYWGPSTPRPLTIMQHIGDTPMKQVCEELLGLTKMNWNSASFSMHEPITLSFSRDVGGLLSEAETKTVPKERYLYYM